ncbi:hypothetical protein BDDG_00895 [Blastomyces dermatitidis ATCC 18188]|uniref:Uncharacterized protein n=1 Tax=Ajellomyces dermatitidis (strain ATCC 18188 / CBS 674.68) TaxID=653446 RepID=F2T3F6_AJEDA|nr:hypothetical protein BDDG_00895 [Blastomyces dermatitidis ATCC 18188]
MAEALELLASLGFTTRAGRQIHANLVDVMLSYVADSPRVDEPRSGCPKRWSADSRRTYITVQLILTSPPSFSHGIPDKKTGGENSASRSPGRSKPPKSNYYYFPTSVLFGSFIVARSQQLLLRWASHAIPFQIRISMSDPRQEPVILQTQRNDTTDASMLKYFEGGSKQSP